MSIESTPYGDQSNSFCDVASADKYHLLRLHNAEWSDADTSEKEAALVQATIFLNDLNWRGRVESDSSQALRFPREGLKDADDRVLTGIPSFLVSATCELALSFIREEYVAPSIAAAQKKIKAGAVEMEFFERVPNRGPIPDVVMSLVRTYLTSGPNNVPLVRT